MYIQELPGYNTEIAYNFTQIQRFDTYSVNCFNISKFTTDLGKSFESGCALGKNENSYTCLIQQCKNLKFVIDLS